MMSVMAFALRSVLQSHPAVGRRGQQVYSSASLLLITICSTSPIHLQRGDKGLLRNVDLAELPHLLLAFLLLLQKFSLSRDVAAVAFCRHVLAQRADGLARDHLAADRSLNRNLEHVWRGHTPQPPWHWATSVFRPSARPHDSPKRAPVLAYVGI